MVQLVQIITIVEIHKLDGMIFNKLFEQPYQHYSKCQGRRSVFICQYLYYCPLSHSFEQSMEYAKKQQQSMHGIVINCASTNVIGNVFQCDVDMPINLVFDCVHKVVQCFQLSQVCNWSKISSSEMSIINLKIDVQLLYYYAPFMCIKLCSHRTITKHCLSILQTYFHNGGYEAQQ